MVRKRCLIAIMVAGLVGTMLTGCGDNYEVDSSGDALLLETAKVDDDDSGKTADLSVTTESGDAEEQNSQTEPAETFEEAVEDLESEQGAPGESEEDTSTEENTVINIVYEDPTNQASDYYDKEKAIAVFNMINAERTANGISQLTWNEETYNFACRRAREIVDDFSHNGCGNYGENIYWSTGTSSAEEIHTAYYNSPKHHENYLRSSYEGGAVAVYVLNGKTYCSENFSLPRSSSDTVVNEYTREDGIKVIEYADGTEEFSPPEGMSYCQFLRLCGAPDEEWIMRVCESQGVPYTGPE